MFKQVKSALFWYYIYKFRRRVAAILTLIVLIFLSEYIYSDIVEYLQIRHKEEWLDFLLPLKWALIFGAVFTIFYLILTMFKAPKQEPQEKPAKKLTKKEIRQLAEELIQKKRSAKS